MLVFLALIPIKAKSVIVYLECSGFETRNDSSETSKTYSVIFALDESNSRLKMREVGENTNPDWQKASFNASYIAGKIGKKSFLINRHQGSYSFTISKDTNKNGTWSSNISGECKKEANKDQDETDLF